MATRLDCQLYDCGEPHHTQGYCAKHWYEMTPQARAFVALYDVPVISPRADDGIAFLAAVNRTAA